MHDFPRCSLSLQVSSVFHDASIGNAVNIVLVKIILLEEDQVSYWTSFSHEVFLICHRGCIFDGLVLLRRKQYLKTSAVHN